MEEAIKKCGFESLQELDKNMRPSVYSKVGPETAVKLHVEKLAHETALARQLLPCELNVEYGPGERQKLDFYYPKAIPKSRGDREGVTSVFVYFHGGGWQILSRDHGGGAAVMLARNAGAVTVAAGYDLAPQVTLTNMADQCTAAVLFVARRFPQATVVAGGHSAGAHLAACLLHTDWARHGLDHSPVRGVYLMDGLYDVAPCQLCSDNRALSITDREVVTASPSLLPVTVEGVHAMVLTVQHTSPEYNRQARRYHEWLMKAGVVGHFFHLGNEDHFTMNEALSDENSFPAQVLSSFIKTLSSSSSHRH